MRMAKIVRVPALRVALAGALLVLGLGPCLAQTIRLGVTPGPHAQIAEAVVPVARAQGLEVKVIEFSDGTLINAATNEGELEANAFQHGPYLEGQIKDRGYDLVSIAKTVLLPMAAYSKRVAALGDLPQKAKVSIPNDPTNGGRALKLLEAGGLLTLKPGLGFASTVFDIDSNPKNLRILELEATQVPRSLDDVDLAVINTNYALATGLDPLRDSLLREGDLSQYFCLIAVRRQDADQPWAKVLRQSR